MAQKAPLREIPVPGSTPAHLGRSQIERAHHSVVRGILSRQPSRPFLSQIAVSTRRPTHKMETFDESTGDDEMTLQRRWVIVGFCWAAAALWPIGCDRAGSTKTSDSTAGAATAAKPVAGDETKAQTATTVSDDANETEGDATTKKRGWPLTRRDHVLDQTGWLKGVIKIKPAAIQRINELAKVDISSSPECVKANSGEEALANSQVTLGVRETLSNVFVYIRASDLSDFAFPAPPSDPVLLDVHQCVFSPPTFGIHIGQDLRLLNADSFSHIVNIVDGRPATVELPKMERLGVFKEKWFQEPQIGVEITCSKHPWERTYACVMEHPAWGISNEKGQVYIPNVPLGTYTLEFWHPPVAGLKVPPPQEIEITQADGTATLFVAWFE